MPSKRSIFASLSIVAVSLMANIAPAMADQWYFYVKNNSNSKITGLFVSETGSSWGYFDIGSGIAPGEKSQLFWDKSTNSELCNQFVKASFADGTESAPTKINFCQDLDTPIVFSE
ncbi:MAG: hypothetical protein NW214_06070 [Pseudanabaenaceae cyanobacterium bins.39]|nr:hypothetical protein [Pseudanabaenaceae cyanobacterium bins.39]